MLPINIFQVALEELSGNRKISILLPNLVSFISNQVAFIICFFSRLLVFLDFLTDEEKTEDVEISLNFPKNFHRLFCCKSRLDNLEFDSNIRFGHIPFQRQQ